MACEEKVRNIPLCDSRRRNDHRLSPNTSQQTTPLRLLPWKSGKRMETGNRFGTPSYPSPLDRLRTGRSERARQLGLETSTNYADFESNQSFPGTTRPSTRCPRNLDMADFKRCTLASIKANTQNSVSFAAGSSKGCFGYSPNVSRRSRPLSGSWVHYGFVGGGQTGVAFPTGIQNPNKAVITINSKSSEILMANKMACRLLAVQESELSGKRLCNFLRDGSKWYTTHDAQLGSGGELVTIAGKVMEMVSSEGEVIPVSVWIHRIAKNDEPRDIVVLEPVTRTIASVIFDKQGIVLCADEQLAILHGYRSTSSLKGLHITELLPFLDLPRVGADSPKLPKEIKKQNTTARTSDGITFPVTVHVKSFQDAGPEKIDKDCEVPLYKAIVWVFANISGLVTVFPDGSIHSCNDNFSLTLFGYSQSQLVGKNITSLIPSFYDDLEFLDAESILLPPLDDDDDEEDSQFAHPSLCRNNSYHSQGTPRPTNPIGKQIELMIEDVSQAVHSLALDTPSQFVQFLRNSSVSEPPTRSPSADCFLGSTPVMPSGSCHAQLNSASTCGEKPLSCFGYVSDSGRAPGDVAKPRVDETARSGNQDAVQIPKNGSFCNTNRTAEKELVREKLSLPIKLEVDLAKAMPSSKSCLDRLVTPVDCSVGSLPGSPAVATNDRQFSLLRENDVTSTPNDIHERPPKFVMNRYGSLESLQSIPEGSYFGLGLHKNGSDIAIIYQIKRVELDDGHLLYCLWISRDPEEMAEGGRPCYSLSFQSSLFSTSRHSAKTSLFENESYECSHEEKSFQLEEGAFEKGSYSTHYTTLNQIGKGGYGYIKMAYRNSDKLLVVTKFVDKKRVYEESWVYDSSFNKKMPLEISLLLTLKHPNIVQVIDVFENELACQLVLEKHGSGMDLFEFIDRDPALDEPLASYIFRQIASAVAYLHRLNIVHRDLKDENVIVNHLFHVKLIDFGSATFMAPDRLFTTFCGTTEFCSPEVLQGNKYRGPELEMWALGTTLYAIIYGENPFFTMAESIAGVLNPPFAVSQSLMHLLSHMLNPDPIARCTVTEAVEHPWTNQPVSSDKYIFQDIIWATNEEVNPVAYYNPEKTPALSAKSRKSTSASTTSDECYEEQDSFS